MNFKINSRPFFTIIFKLKNDNFKTLDFSPLIERVLAGVMGSSYFLITEIIVFSGIRGMEEAFIPKVQS